MSDGMMGGMPGGVFSPWLALLRDLSVKSALLLLTAWALTLATRRASAAVRHLVWLLAFAGLLLLPLLSVALPARTVAVLPPPAVPLKSLNKSSLRGPLAPNSGGTGEAISGSPRIGGFIGVGGGGVSSSGPLSAPAPVLLAPALPPAMPDWPMLLCLLWLLGVALAALPLAAGWTLAGRRLRRCSPITDPATLALAAEAGRRLGLRRPVSLRSGPSVSVPVTFGLVRPVILLPDGAASWPAERLRVALLHEMAHVRRGDWATQTAARLACALFWHDPLVWPAARMLRAEAEHACDDLVLSSGIPAPDYAQHLLAVAAALSGADRPLPLAVPMAGRGPLESRLRAVLTARPRRAPSRRLAVLAFVLTLSVLVPLAVLRPAARAARRMAPPLTPAPVVLPAPPEAARPFHSPVRVAAAPLHAPVLIKSTPRGVSPMKPLTPVKAVALTALTALTLPVAHAKPIPVPKAAAPPVVLAPTPKLSSSAAPTANMLHWDMLAVQTPLKTMMALLPWGHGGKNPDGVKNIAFYMRKNSILVNATPTGLAEVQREVQMIAAQLPAVVEPRPDVSKAFGDLTKARAAPRQVQIKFEWVSSVSAPGAAPDKNMEALTIIAEEGRKSQVSSQHLRNGVGGQETISVLTHLEPGGVVVLDITERSDSTARVGDTKSDSTEATVRVKDGETGTVRGQMSKHSGQDGQSAERMLFVTPTIVRPAE